MEDADPPVPLFTQVKKFCLHFFPTRRCTSTVCKFTILKDCMRTSLTFPTTSKEPCLGTREFCAAKGKNIKIFLMIFCRYLCPKPFFYKEMKTFGRPDAFMLHDSLVVDFFSTSEKLYPKIVVWLQLIRARANFYKVGDDLNASIGVVDCSL